MSIFMIGTQRSGSNLLRLMLNQIGDLAAPHSPHILQRMMPLLPTYGDLSQTDSFTLLVNDVCRLVELNPVPWEGVHLDTKEVISLCRERSLVAIFASVYDIMAQTWGAQQWCCKSLANVYYLPEITAYLENPKFIYLYRDGRDVAVSFKKAVVGEKHFYHIAQEWAKAQRLALQMRSRLSPQRFFSISYETLISSPETTLQDLCNFLGVQYTPEMLDFHQSQEASNAATSSSLWSNVTQPVIKQNTKKFLQEATDEEILIFELVAGDVLDALGYERVGILKGKEIKFSSTAIAKFNGINQSLKAEARQKMDPEDLKRRDRQATLLKEIKARQTVVA
ncbi:sulfotransferase [Moorena producens PAL-8-15-08-1]|uniref:Sulfotransferase n=1 Tax=Moorena producens PAL-8-15-08-1 TaxID=1458985 RepID=A0A1D8TRB8_9CYAN|nr:sulfotransferase [Moorena producens]AOX00155.1 sulfotransferase [Moorena producens PAL-8-15-08-1]